MIVDRRLVDVYVCDAYGVGKDGPRQPERVNVVDSIWSSVYS
jgi:hypothetical protein